MQNLPNVTLLALTSINIKETVKALKYSMRGINFGDCLLLSHKKPDNLTKNIRYEQIDKIKCIDDFNYKMIFDIHKYINTEYILLVHYDGFVVNPQMWRSEFLDYDYIGSPWPDNEFKDIHGNTVRVGNSVSIRSKKLLELPSILNIPFNYGENEINHEDTFLCCRYRHLLEKNGIRFAPLDVAKYFAHELMIPEIKGIKPFAFHKWRGSNAKYKCFNKYKNLKIKMKYLLNILNIYKKDIE